MSDVYVLYFFGFLLVSNLILSLVYAFGTSRIKAAIRKANRREADL